MKNWHVRKPLPTADVQSEGALARTLGGPHLVAMGAGAIVGTGIPLIGVGAAKARSAVLSALVIAGLLGACSALVHAPMATDGPGLRRT